MLLSIKAEDEDGSNGEVIGTVEEGRREGERVDERCELRSEADDERGTEDEVRLDGRVDVDGAPFDLGVRWREGRLWPAPVFFVLGLDLPALGEMEVLLEDDDNEPPETPISTPAPLTLVVLPPLPASVIVDDDDDDMEGTVGDKSWSGVAPFPEDCIRANWKLVEEVDRTCPFVPTADEDVDGEGITPPACGKEEGEEEEGRR